MNASAALWIGGAIVGFLAWWPIGVAILATVLITAISQQLTGYAGAGGAMVRTLRTPQFLSGSTGNTAFDQYRAETLRQLESDQQAFYGFMDKLRRAKDREEFDRFMSERRR